ncbi:uncharacterized protein LOC127837617 isoform X1 [Dreissena polymorpha]|uniref:uncharacterized protein LOC127837617 isoform X1 n=1 Tax=Dreissena polymorpha TaxID=45954 RepID=UPI00226481EC|nr:uncharacterized protein LOC127837617 isoform X1 [Dreissena polymorpha]XP_052220825.1 uncharacterized protein LOC127837617 isoform X1 [Dreissena polymorpha]
MDLESAFRLIPISPTDFHLLGFSVNNLFYFDKALVFGASISCAIFERFAKFLKFCIKQNFTSGDLIQYLDDFLGANTSYTSCLENMATFRSVTSNLGVPVAEEKTDGPTTILTFLGLILDTNKMEIRIPKPKLQQVREKIEALVSKQKATLKEIQSLIGSLNFCCRAIPLGRPFCRRLIDKTCGLTKPHHHCRLTKEIRKDLMMWLQFFKYHNGISVFHDRFWISNEESQLYSDSAGAIGLGFGAFFHGRWCQGAWPPAWLEEGLLLDITVLELFPIVVAMFVWGDDLCNKKIRFNCDNIAVVHILNKLSAKSEPVMTLVRILTMRCLQKNILIKASHVPGASNDICDALSRFQMTRFRALAPEAADIPDNVPSFLWDIFTKEQQYLQWQALP